MWIKNSRGYYINLKMAWRIMPWDTGSKWYISAEFANCDTQYFSPSKNEKESQRKIKLIMKELNT